MSAEALLRGSAAAMAEAVRSGAETATALVQASLMRICATDERASNPAAVHSASR